MLYNIFSIAMILLGYIFIEKVLKYVKTIQYLFFLFGQNRSSASILCKVFYFTRHATLEMPWNCRFVILGIESEETMCRKNRREEEEEKREGKLSFSLENATGRSRCFAFNTRTIH